MKNIEVRNIFHVDYEEPQSLAALCEVFRVVRGFDPFFLIGSIDDELSAEIDLTDIKSGEYVPEDSGHEHNCREMVFGLRSRLMKLIVDDGYFAKSMSNQNILGQHVREIGKFRVYAQSDRDPIAASAN